MYFLALHILILSAYCKHTTLTSLTIIHCLPLILFLILCRIDFFAFPVSSLRIIIHLYNEYLVQEMCLALTFDHHFWWITWVRPKYQGPTVLPSFLNQSLEVLAPHTSRYYPLLTTHLDHQLWWVSRIWPDHQGPTVLPSFLNQALEVLPPHTPHYYPLLTTHLDHHLWWITRVWPNYQGPTVLPSFLNQSLEVLAPHTPHYYPLLTTHLWPPLLVDHPSLA